MNKTRVGVAVMGVGTVLTAVAMRKEMRRYLAIKRAARNPDMVGRSITPQGNERALGRSDAQRRENRRSATSRPTDPEMPDLQPGDQAG